MMTILGIVMDSYMIHVPLKHFLISSRNGLNFQTFKNNRLSLSFGNEEKKTF